MRVGMSLLNILSAEIVNEIFTKLKSGDIPNCPICGKKIEFTGDDPTMTHCIFCKCGLKIME